MTIQVAIIPEWITAIGTAGAFLTAAVTLAYDHAQRRRALADQQASQARLVAVRTGDFTVADDETRRPVQVTVHIANHSQWPIFEVTIHPEGAWRMYWHISTFDPGEQSFRAGPAPVRPQPTSEPKVWIRFRDTQGIPWGASSMGELVRLPTSNPYIVRGFPYMEKRARAQHYRDWRNSDLYRRIQSKMFRPRMAMYQLRRKIPSFRSRR